MDIHQLSDEEVTKRLQEGDSSALALLIDRYEQKLTRYGRKFLRADDDVKDAVQEAFIKAYVNIQSFDPTRRFSPWIYRIAHNEFVNAIKKRKETVSLSDVDILFPHPIAKESANDGANANELKRLLDGGLDKLDAKYREPLVLYYFEDMDYKEIADILHLPVATVGVRLKRGREALLKEVGDKRYNPESRILTFQALILSSY
jgi:RNA polymerase sigma-70 factor (ECF subfamily)